MEDVPGYDVQELLGYGGTGEVWRAVHRATGETVALKRLRCEVCAPDLVREAALQQSIDTPYLLRLRDVLSIETSTVLVLDHAPGGSLAHLLARRGSLEPGEVVTIAAPLAQALAAVHAQGLVHGHVSPTSVLFTADGMPLLSDLGLARPVGTEGGPVDAAPEFVDPQVAAGSVASAASDVWSLAAVCRRLGGPGMPPDLAAVVASALGCDGATRPNAAGFAAALRRAHPPAPVRLNGPVAVLPGHQSELPASAAPASSADRRGPRRVVLLGASGALALLLAGGVGWASGQRAAVPAGAALPVFAPAAAVPRSPSAEPSPRLAVVRGPDNWRAVLDRLDRTRAEAFAQADVSMLGAVWAPGATAFADDAAAVRRLVVAGRTAAGVRHRIVALRVVHGSPQRVALRVTDVLDAAVVRDARGRVVHLVGARAAASYDVVLVLVRGSWLLATVTFA